MKQGDFVRVVASNHSDVPTGCVGSIDCGLSDGYGVTITAEFFIPGVVPARRLETRTVWFRADSLELMNLEEERIDSDILMACPIGTDPFGAQGCVSCDQALIRAGG